MPKIIIIEDEASIRESLADYFELHEYHVSAHELGRSGLDAALGDDASIVLLDLMLPDVDGLDVLERLRARSRVPVIILTARGEEAQRIRGLRLGADDYVVKPFSIHELLARVEAVLRRTGTVPDRIRLGDAEIDLAGHRVKRGDEVTRLLAKEAELLAFFLRNQGRSIGREEILREVWGYDAMPTTRTVDTHVFQLRRKIEGQGQQPRFFKTVHGVGYAFVMEE